MNEISVVDFALQSIFLVLIISLPPIVVASVVGLVISFIQAVTQLQEQTLSYGIKLVAVTLTLIVLGPWMYGQIYMYTLQIFDLFFVVTR